MSLRRQFPYEGTFAEFSEKLLRWYAVPNGSKLVLVRAGKGGRRYLRADTSVRRKFFRQDEHPAKSSIRVLDICQAAAACLAPGRHSKILALAPNGEVLDGRIKLSTWRELPGLPTQEERDQAEFRQQYIEELRSSAVGTLRTFEEFIDDPHSDVTEAMLRAMIDRYGASSVREAYTKLRL